MSQQQFTLPRLHENADSGSVREEVSRLEARLAELGLDGDCAYERAMGRLYDALLTVRREQLQAMRAAGL